MAEVTAEINLKLSQFTEGLEKVRAQMAALKKSSRTHGAGVGEEFGRGFREKVSEVMGMVGVPLTFLGVAEGLRRVTENYAHLADVSQRFEASPESMQRLEYHAKLAGTNLESAASAIIKLQVAMENVDDPAVVNAMEELKLSAVDLAGISPERQMEKLAAAFNDAQVSGRGLAATKALLGKGFAELIPMMREWEEISKHTVPIVSDANVAAMKRADDTLTRIGANMKVIAGTTAAVAVGESQSVSPDSMMGRLLGVKKKKGAVADKAPDGPDLERIKEWTAKEETAQRIKQAAAEKTAKAIQEAQAKEGELTKRLADAHREAMESEYNEGEKIESAKARLKDLELEINFSRDHGPRQAGELLRLEIEQANVLKEIGGLEKQILATNQEQDRVWDDMIQKGMEVADQKASQVKQNADSRGDALAELQILEARSHHQDKNAEKIQRELDLEKSKREFMKLGASPEEADRLAHRRQDAQDHINHPGRIHGFKGSGPAAQYGGLDWIRNHGAGGPHLKEEMKFHQLDEMVRLQKEMTDHLKEK